MMVLRTLPDGELYPHYMVGKAATEAAKLDKT